MNLTIDERYSLYSGGKDGEGVVYLSVHDETLDKSKCIKHVANLLHVMRRSIDKNKQSIPFIWLVLILVVDVIIIILVTN